VGHDRNGARIGSGRRVEPRSGVATRQSAGRVCPVERRVDREKMRQVVLVRVHELVDPPDPDRPVPACLDRERWSVMEQEPAARVAGDRAIAPYGRGRHAGWQDLLRQLPHRDLVVVDRLAAPLGDRPRPRHDRRNEQRGDVLGEVLGVKRCVMARNGANDPRAACEGYEEQSGPGCCRAGKELTPGKYRRAFHFP
jgi:hypothetical protein